MKLWEIHLRGGELSETLGIAHPAKKKWYGIGMSDQGIDQKRKEREEEEKERKKENECGHVHFDLLLEVCQSLHRMLRGFCCLVHHGVGLHGYDRIV